MVNAGYVSFVRIMIQLHVVLLFTCGFEMFHRGFCCLLGFSVAVDFVWDPFAYFPHFHHPPKDKLV